MIRESIAALRYGTIAVNTWTGLGYLTRVRRGAPSRVIRWTTFRAGAEWSTTLCYCTPQNAPW
jgi:hypothetical protein